MSGPENTFIGSVHKLLPPVSKFYRMKNHNVYNGGIADVWYSGKRDLWVEYKFAVLPKRPGVIDLTHSTPKTKPAITVLQQDWIRGRHKEGREVWVIVGFKEGGVVFTDETWAKKTLTSADYRFMMLTRAEVAKKILHWCHP